MRIPRVALAQLVVMATIGAVNVAPLQRVAAVGLEQSLQNRFDGLIDSLVALEPGETITNQPPPGIIDTIAGQAAVRGVSGDGGPSVDALLNQPSGLGFDADGNLFVADFGNLLVRRIDAASGVITTVAGGGTSTPWVGTGPATTAYLSAPRNVRVLPDGDLYIADSSKIRRVDLDTGTISTVAGSGEAFCCSGFAGDGGPANEASLRSPYDMAMGQNGDLYIADTGNQVIRRVDASTGVISTFAGTPGIAGFGGDGGPASAAQFSGPRSLATDGEALYVSDSGNSAVRRIDLTSGLVSTVAGGPGSAGLVLDGSPATSGRLFRPYGIALDADGDLYIAENGMSRIRRVDAATGVISTVVGTSTGDCGDGGPSIQACIYAGDPLAVAPNGVLALGSQNRIALVTPAPAPDPVMDSTLVYERGGCCTPNRLTAGWTLPATAVNRVRVTTSPGGASVVVAASVTRASIAALEPDERYTATIVAGNGWERRRSR